MAAARSRLLLLHVRNAPVARGRKSGAPLPPAWLFRRLPGPDPATDVVRRWIETVLPYRFDRLE